MIMDFRAEIWAMFPNGNMFAGQSDLSTTAVTDFISAARNEIRESLVSDTPPLPEQLVTQHTQAVNRGGLRAEHDGPQGDGPAAMAFAWLSPLFRPQQTLAIRLSEL